MKVSIIIPIFRVECFIEACLNSVVAQSYDNIECILVNDATPDDSMKVVEKFIQIYKGNISFVIINHSINKGLSAARNTGIKNATGDYLLFLDSDDEICPNAIRDFVNNAEHNNMPDFVIGGIRVISENNEQFKESIASNLLTIRSDYQFSNRQITKSYYHKEWYVMAWNKLVKKSFLLENALFFEESILHEDHLWSLMLAANSRSMGIVSACTYVYKVRTNSITGTIRRRNIESLLIVLKKSYEYVTSFHNVYLLAKLFEMSIFIIHQIGLSDLCRKDKLKSINTVKNVLKPLCWHIRPLSFVDIGRQLLISLPSNLLEVIMSYKHR